jgi:16S rRNA (cytidine1402-2'-O)-methyltransferase
MKGTIYLIPNTLGPTSGHKVLPKDVQETLRGLSYFIVENERTARAFIKNIHPDKNQKELRFEIIDKQTDPLDLPLFLQPVELGEDVGIISEAGVPCVADPGSEIVSIAHRKGLRVVPLVGPSSILLALMASGFNGQQFTFRGYLPFDKPMRKRVFQAMIKDCKDGITQIFMETPYRNNKLMEELAATLHPDTKLCIAVDITLDTEFIATKTIAQWRNEHVDLHKRPTIFLID